MTSTNNYLLSAKTISTALILTFSSLSAQDRQFFSQRDFGAYYLSDIYAPMTNISIGQTSNSDEYNIQEGRDDEYIPISEITLGTDLPIFRSEKGKHFLSYSIPISFQLWYDVFERKVTSPVLNTDYRVALEINYLIQINKGFIKNIGIKYQPAFHESSHIGDELTIYRKDQNLPITRVNVSYEATDLALVINDPLSQLSNNVSAKLGARALYSKKRGWYYSHPKDADVSKLPESKKWMEPYFQLEIQKADGFLSTNNLMFVFSMDARLRVKLGYPSYTINQKLNTFEEHPNNEDYSPSVNLITGWQVKGSTNERSRFGFFFRHYQGLNFHGQFRNTDDFKFTGISLIYG